MYVQAHSLAAIDRAQLAAELVRLSPDRLDAAAIDRVYGAMVLHRAELYGADRLDANESIVLQQQLEQMRLRTADILRPAYKARQLVPTTSEMDPGAESWAYSVWDRAGMAKIIANYADDIPKVALLAKKYSHTVETLALGYDWSWLDLQRTARAGIPLRARKSQAVRDGFEQRIEEIAAIGIRDTGAKGLLNNPNVPVMNAAAPASGSDAHWAGPNKTPYEIMADLERMEDAIVLGTKTIHAPDTLVLPLTLMRRLERTPLSTVAPADPKDTILKVFLEKSKVIRNIDWWQYCDKAGPGGTPMAIMYKRDPSVVHLEIPLEQQEMPPQAKNLTMEINSVGRIGGVAWEYPLAAVYLYGI